jgi:hypothetical protein
MFNSNTTFKLVSDDCLEKIYDFSDIFSPPKPISYCRVPMLNIDSYDNSASNAHFYSESGYKYPDNIIERLQRSVMHYRSAQSQMHLGGGG